MRNTRSSSATSVGGPLTCQRKRSGPLKNTWRAAADLFPSTRLITVGETGRSSTESSPSAAGATATTSPGGAGHHAPATEFVVTIRNHEHPITKGLPDFWMHTKDECYSHLRGPAENLTIFETACDSPELQAAGTTIQSGERELEAFSTRCSPTDLPCYWRDGSRDTGTIGIKRLEVGARATVVQADCRTGIPRSSGSGPIGLAGPDHRPDVAQRSERFRVFEYDISCLWSMYSIHTERKRIIFHSAEGISRQFLLYITEGSQSVAPSFFRPPLALNQHRLPPIKLSPHGHNSFIALSFTDTT